MASGPFDLSKVRELALIYLEGHHTVSLATNGPDGIWASSVFYASADFTLYFLSEPKTRHAQNLLHGADVAATINEDYHDWRKIKGIQLSGSCVEVEERAEIEVGLGVYVRKFPFVSQFLDPGRLLEGAQVAGHALNVRLYRLTPTRVLYLDNERGFSNREEIPLES